MTAFIFLISFLLHIITLAAIVLILKQVQGLKKANTNELMELFETYLNEIREENKRLEQQLQAKEPAVQRKHNDAAAVMDADMPIPEQAQEPETPSAAFKPAIPDADSNDRVEASLQAKILQMHKQGLPIDIIAQKLNCGKTEAELIIKLYAKKE